MVDDDEGRLAEAETQRQELRLFMAERQLTVKGWSRQAGLVPGVLRNFLNRRSHNLTSRSLLALSRAAGVTVAEMLPSSMASMDGDTPATNGGEAVATSAAIEAVLREVVEALRRVEAQLAFLTAEHTKKRLDDVVTSEREPRASRKPTQ